MEILHKADLPEGGFAGLKEHRMVKGAAAFGSDANSDGSWPSLGHFVYLADARFMPRGETRMHKHLEIDVISVMVDGNISHQGSMGHGENLCRNDVQVQRAGGEGFSHNEINPDDHENRMIQLWVLPEQSGQAASYKVYRPGAGSLTHIYGGEDTTNNAFPAKTHIDVALLDAEQKIEIPAVFLAYLTRGTGIANGENIRDGDLIRGNSLKFEAREPVQLIVIYTSSSSS
ncbi:MAG: pilus assembly protein [Gammaproteobacteria bacterium]|nr:pilus assembly protein [Gammaproteobacteria bacterium]